METLEVRRQENITLLSLNRPQRLNAFNFEMMDELDALFKRLIVQVPDMLIIRGNGSFFCAGADVKAFSSLRSRNEGSEMASRMTHIMEALEEMPFPVVSYFNGDAYGGGVELSLFCDVRLAARGVRLGFTQKRFHLAPALGSKHRFERLIGVLETQRLLDEQAIIDSDEAMRLGLIDALCEPEKVVEIVNRRFGTGTNADFVAWKAMQKQLKSDPKLTKLELHQFGDLWERPEHHQAVAEFLRRKI